MSYVIAAAAAGLLCIACTASPAKGKPPAAIYPAVLQGTWMGDSPEACKGPDAADSDSRFQIAPRKLSAYEDWREPVSVVQISKTPQAWKIVSQLHINEDSIRLEEVLLLSGEDNGELTVVNHKQSNTYYRCR
ncbi:hypothetical protein ASE43_13925 [Lysobacter sp. Root983]|nr:hypothetical protein ASD69_16695 [Lysobacter sp. Root604]KRD75924.1 hypothetical protein ASE43_13925 [Lysobacter sp. Root983]